MASETASAGWLTRRRAARARRREVREAVRGEWELEPRPRGWAAVRAFAKQVGELEQARLVAHAEAARRSPIPRPAATTLETGAQAERPASQRAKRV
jgi:hypothetical protein